MKKLLLLILILISGCTTNPFSEITNNHDSNEGIIFDCPEDYDRTDLVTCIEHKPYIFPQQDVNFIYGYYIARGDLCGCVNTEGKFIQDLQICKQSYIIQCYECAKFVERGWQCLKK